jgi:two-component system, LuxR family, response regulator FixJ
MANGTPTVYVIDNDPEVRESLTRAINDMGLNGETYPSAEAFLDQNHDGQHAPKCLILAARLPGLSGLGLQQMLTAGGNHLPIIMISNFADIPMVTSAMKAGAVDFLEKPINMRTLSVSIREAIDKWVCRQRDADHKTELHRHVENLSLRQREVFDLLLTGERSKQIARQLGISEKTVAKHRATVLEKMQVDSVVDLVRLFTDAKASHEIEHAPANQCN